MKRTTPFLVFVPLLLVAGSAAYGQTTPASLYGTNFDKSTTYPYTDTYTYSAATSTFDGDLVGQGNSGQVWTGNDDEGGGAEEGTTSTYKGGLNQVQTSGESSGLGAALLGGVSPTTANGNITVVPGQASVYVAQPLTLTTAATTIGITLTTAYSISASTTAYTSSFGFGFLNASNANVLSVRFVKDANNANQDDVEYQLGTGAVVNAGTSAITLGKTYTLTLTVNVAKNTFSITTGGLTAYSNISLGSTSVSTITQVAALQAVTDTTTDSSGGYIHYGNDQLGFDDFSVVVAPEPSTYMIMGLGLLGLFGVMKFRRMA